MDARQTALGQLYPPDFPYRSQLTDRNDLCAWLRITAVSMTIIRDQIDKMKAHHVAVHGRDPYHYTLIAVHRLGDAYVAVMTFGRLMELAECDASPIFNLCWDLGVR
jgi:hypothetical protein